MEKNENFKEELEKQYNILIQASEKKEKKYFIIIISILAVTLLGTLISCIFAGKAFSSSKNINTEEEEKINEYYKTLSVTFNNGSKLDLRGIGNGYELKEPKTISVTNEGDSDITYRIKLSGIRTSLISSNNLTYTITSNNETSSPRELPLSDKEIISDVKIEPNQTIQYIIKASYTGRMADNDYSHSYSANIVIEQVGDTAEIIS
jgi:hypothetical protein